MSITADSRFVLDVAHASRRRSGRMRREQKHHARILYAAVELEHDAIARSFREILDSLARERPPSLVHPLIITTDEKPDYARTFHAHPLFRFQTDTSRTVHRTVNSTLPRTFKNPLFASNYLDRELRKDLANNHRESACFSRNALSRLACYIFSHNYRKQYLIKSGGFDQRLHATVAGIPHSAIAAGLEEFCSKRQFLSRLSLPPTLDRIWRKTTPTPLKTKKEYLPAFALA